MGAWMRALAAGLLLTGAAGAGRPEWILVWSDEFDAAGAPDPAKWGYEEGLVRNNELQYYTRDRRENARVEDGRLVLEARREAFKGASYTSASLTTRGKASWTGGRIEVKARLPRGRGLWPAVWTLGDDIGKVGWPACGEIDIMEHVGFDPEGIHANIHVGKYNHVKRNGKGARTEVKAAADEFHVYAVEWLPERIDVFVDGRKYFTYVDEKSGPEAWPFDKPQYLILNVAVGGAWGGQKGVDASVFPQRMEVDYVRVYRAR